MLSHARTRLRLLFWAVAAAFVSLPAALAAQSAALRTLGVWIEEARASPFHDLTASDTLANPAAESAVDEGVGLPDLIRPPMTPLPESPDSTVSFAKVFGYTLLAALVPMATAMTIASSGDLVSVFGGWAFTLVSVPVAAMAAGTTKVPETVVGAALGFVAGAVLGGTFAWGLGEFWYSPIYSATMALVTTAIAPR